MRRGRSSDPPPPCADTVPVRRTAPWVRPQAAPTTRPTGVSEHSERTMEVDESDHAGGASLLDVLLVLGQRDGEGVAALLADSAEEVWDRVIRINLKGVWACMKYELRQMCAQGRGAIVNTASILGLVGAPHNPAYTASKHGVVGLTRSAALAYASVGIRVNAVCPGYIHSPMTERVFTLRPEFKETVIARHPLGRMGLPNEIAAAVVWLCSDAASFVTGHTLTVDGKRQLKKELETWNRLSSAVGLVLARS